MRLARGNKSIWDIVFNVGGKADPSLQKVFKGAKAQIKGVQNAAKDVSKNFKSFAGNLGKLTLGAVGGLVAAGTGVVKMAKSVADTGNTIANSANVANMSTQAYQELSYAMAQTGTPAGKLGYGIRRLNDYMSAATTGCENSIKKFTDMGITLDQLREMSPDQVFMSMADHMQGLESDTDRTRKALDFFGRNAGPYLAQSLARGSEGLQSLIEDGRQLGAFMSDEAIEASQNFSNALGDVGTVFKSLKQQFIGPALEPLTKVFNILARELSALSPMVADLGKHFGEWLGNMAQRLPDAIASIKEFGASVWENVNHVKDFVGGWKNVAMILGGIAIAPTLISGLKLVYSVGKFINVAFKALPAIFKGLKAAGAAGFKGIVVAAAPVVAIIAAVAAIIATVIRNFDEIKAHVINAFAGVKEAFQPVLDAFADMSGGSMGFKDVLMQVWNFIEGVLLVAIKGAITVIAGIFEVLAHAASTVVGNFDNIKNQALNTFESIKSAFQPLVDLFTGSDLFGGISAEAIDLKEIFRVVGEFIGTAVVGLITNAITVISGLIRSIVGIVTLVVNQFGIMKDLISGVIQVIIAVFEGDFGRIKEIVSNTFDSIKERVSGNVNAIGEIFGGVVDMITSPFVTAIDIVLETFSRMNDSVRNTLESIRDVAENAGETIKSVFTSMGEAVSSAFEKAKEIISGVFDSILGFIDTKSSAMSEAGETIKSVFSSIGTAVSNALETAKSVVLRVVNTIKGALEPLKSIISSIGSGISSVSGMASNLGSTVSGAAGRVRSLLPGHAEGGIFSRRHIAEIAEKGPEAVIPLDRSRRGMNLWQQAGVRGGYLSGSGLESTVSTVQSARGGYLGGSGLERAVSTVDTVRSVSGSESYSLNFEQNNTFNGNVDSETVKQIETAGQRAADDFANRFGDLMRDKRRVSYA